MLLMTLLLESPKLSYRIDPDVKLVELATASRTNVRSNVFRHFHVVRWIAR
jgi:hypothetical protein